jgi:hypothetical protein
MSSGFSKKELGTELLSLYNTLSKYMQIATASVDILQKPDLDREIALTENKESVQKAISEDTQIAISNCSARISEESRTRRDINIARATRKQLLLSRLNIAYDRHEHIKDRLNNIK